jgi:formate hydrogenlyase transcriptional activator
MRSQDPVTSQDLRPSFDPTLLLQAWEAINSQRDLGGVLSAVAAELSPVVPFNALAIVAFEEGRGRGYALHVVDGPHASDGAPPQQDMARLMALPTPAHPVRQYGGSPLARCMEAGEPYLCPDLLEQPAWFPHEFKLVAAGIRTYTSIPLLVRGTRIGAAVFARRAPRVYSETEMSTLRDISRALGVAVANALANEEIAKLRDQLEAENVALRSQLGEKQRFEEIVGESASLRRVLDAIEQVAATDATVLIHGETGTGKELVVRALHRLSPRARGALVKINCAAVPETLIAAELFGHERGAFTGAVERRKGRFEQAHRGTLFLDEISELPSETQVLLLRVLQEREFERLGGNDTLKVDVRLIAATNRDLTEDVRSGRFRSDLFYRLNVFPIRLPPLRERREDIPLLVSHFATKHGTRFKRPISRIDRRTMSALEAYEWPGNVRELENAIERAVILSANGILRLDRDALPLPPGGDLKGDLRTREREAMEAALRASGGRIAGPKGAAKRLGLAPSTLEFRLARLGIDKFRYRPRTSGERPAG